MTPDDGLTLFFVFLGIFGAYSFFASVIYFDTCDEYKGRIFQAIFIVVLFVFMGFGLYFYNVPIPR